MTHLQDELSNLKDSLNQMNYLVMSQISKSIDSLIRFDKDLAQEVIKHERRVNALEIQIDKQCETIFTLMTPVAKDMRFVFATLKINNDLERIADYAENNCHMVLDLSKPFDEVLLTELRLEEMSKTVISMQSDIIVAYSSENAGMARGVFTEDLILNEIHKKAAPIIAEQCKKDPDNIINYMNLWSVIRRLERIGDHITNVGEEIIFYIEATVLKHSGKEMPERRNKNNKP